MGFNARRPPRAGEEGGEVTKKLLREWTTQSGRNFRLFKDGEIRLDKQPGPMLLSGWEPAFARELFRLATELAEAEEAIREADVYMSESRDLTSWGDIEAVLRARARKGEA